MKPKYISNGNQGDCQLDQSGKWTLGRKTIKEWKEIKEALPF